MVSTRSGDEHEMESGDERSRYEGGRRVYSTLKE